MNKKMNKIEKQMFAEMEERIAIEMLKKAVWHLCYAYDGIPEDLWEMLDKKDRTNSPLWKGLMDALNKYEGDRIDGIYALIDGYKSEMAKLVR